MKTTVSARRKIARRSEDPVVEGRPVLRDPLRDDRSIEELAELLAAALVEDLQQSPSPAEFKPGDDPMVVSPPGATRTTEGPGIESGCHFAP